MRTSLAFVVLLLAVPNTSSADAFLFTTSDESRIRYGAAGAVHEGLPFFSQLEVSRDGVVQLLDWRNVATRFVATGGPLLSHTVQTSGDGTVVGSTYRYDGGSFRMFFDLIDNVTREERSGFFVAPIVSAMTLTVEESPLDDADKVRAFYQLGPGLFDAGLADALGLRRRTVGGTISDPFLTFGTGDAESPVRTAWEGAPHVTIHVPEPASLLLTAAAGLGLAIRRRRTP
jgi:hypothetical protein